MSPEPGPQKGVHGLETAALALRGRWGEATAVQNRTAGRRWIDMSTATSRYSSPRRWTRFRVGGGGGFQERMCWMRVEGILGGRGGVLEEEAFGW